MNKPGFLEGVVVALVACVTGSIGNSVVSVFYSEEITWRILMSAISFGYSIYLLVGSQQKTGCIIVLLGWLLMNISLWLFHPPLFQYALIHLVVVWLIRSVYFHANILYALLDLGLIILGVAAGFWAFLQSGSLLLSLWCFFLVQAVFVALADSHKKAHSDHFPISRHTKFQQAFHSAQSAVEDLSRS